MKEVRLQNFRCYEDQTISFKSGINLLVGDNASGKTSVLKACRYVLSAFFCGFSDENTKWVNPDVDDFRHIEVDGILSQELPINISFDVADVILYPQLLPRGSSYGRYILVKNSKKNSRPLTSGIKGYKDYAALLKGEYFNDSGQQKALPLFANFSTEDIHSTRKIDAGRFNAYYQKPSFGYYECLEGDGFFPYWIKRLLILKEGGKNEQEIAIVRRAISEALGAEGCNIIQEMHIRPLQKKVYYQFMDGREVEAAYLSDGYLRLVHIVTDIAFRCALLNRGIFGEEACINTNGTVLIDEIDLHLHPTLQALVLKGLRKAFPRLQFIVSSHAPMVMSGVESNEENVVYKLEFSSEEGYSVVPVVTYGMDLSTISKVVLNQTPRTSQTEAELNNLFALIDEDQIAAATAMLQVMKERYAHNLPELAEAEAMLNCIIPGSDEEN